MALGFSKILKQKREALGKTQQEMASLLEVTLRQYQRYEDKTTPNWEKISILSQYLNYDFFSHLSGAKGKIMPPTSTEMTLHEKALLKVLLGEVAKLKADRYGMKISDVLKEIDQSTSLEIELAESLLKKAGK